MPETLKNAFPYVTGALFGLALLLFLVSFRLFRRSRTDVFWRRRRDAGQRGWRLFVAGALLLLLSAASCGVTLLISLFGGESNPAVTETPQQAVNLDTPLEPVETDTLIPSITPEPFQADPETPVLTPPDGPSPTPAPPETVVVIIIATPTFTPTDTPFPTFTPVSPPLESSVTPLPNAQIVITALDDQISDALTPINPRNVFAAGVKRVYLFVEFQGMAQGVLWKRTLYRNGELAEGNAYLWGLESEGTGYFFFGNDNGFEPGQYDIRLYIGDTTTPINTMAFTVTAAP